MISILRRKITCCFFADYTSPHSIPRSFFLRLFSTSNKEACVSSAAIFDLLRHKHQFSAEVATKAASVLNRRLKDTEKCNSMLSYLQQRGFSNTQMEKMVKVWPELLLARFDYSIEPKITFFQDMGFSSEDITEIISANPCILRINLNRRIIPLLSMLKGLLGNNKAAAKFLIRSGWFLTESFRKSVEKAEEMGVNRNSGMFIRAVRTLAELSGNVLEHKVQALRNCGFTESDILVLFQKAPSVFVMSADNHRAEI
ncbi:uncharacterized protein LOC127257107 [Andrographis paniculata]|uniref:uncharacterized protein LOC127257107 n=1 Tax=Andrographis paniculata TaxID=175694 RepID=UPI0021E7F627|nr:uncharacterized protein LOC127257107 [Andrographis paniculata]